MPWFAVPKPARPARVLCVGHAAFDAVYRIPALPARPTKVKATGYGQSVGGMAANAACTIAALGGDAHFLGPIGDDEIGDRVVAALQEAGVATDTVVRVAGARTSHSAIIVQADGERLIVSHHGDALEADAGATSAVFMDQAAAAATDRAPVVLVDVRWPAGARRVCAQARERGIVTVLDGEMGNPALLAELVPRIDHLVFSEPGFAEWRAFAGIRGEIDEVLAGLVAAGATLAAVTRGENGVVWACRTAAEGVRTGRLAAFPVQVVETLGAGDAFHGAYALALAEGHAIDDTLRFAAAAAALRCTRRAADRNPPTRDDVSALLAIEPTRGNH